jgi:septum formation protein
MTAPTAPAPLVLASASTWRLGLLTAAGIPARAVPAPIDEQAIQRADPVALAQARAMAKALAVAALCPGSWVVGADQVVHLDGASIGKPRDPADWLGRLRALRGRTHALTTAVALVAPDGGVEAFEEHSAVRFRADLSDEDLLAYVSFGEAAGCAGGYMVEGRGAWLVEAVGGDWSNVVGLPVFSLIGRLRARGWRLGADGRAAPGVA